MVINIIIIALGIIAFVSGLSVIYYHLEYRRACRNFLIRSYLLEILEQKKAASIIIAATTFSFCVILAVYKQNYNGG
jgi:hypothetical protein